MKLWKLRLTWCTYCQRIVRWQRGAHLSTHPLPPGISTIEGRRVSWAMEELTLPGEEWDKDEC